MYVRRLLVLNTCVRHVRTRETFTAGGRGQQSRALPWQRPVIYIILYYIILYYRSPSADRASLQPDPHQSHAGASWVARCGGGSGLGRIDRLEIEGVLGSDPKISADSLCRLGARPIHRAKRPVLDQREAHLLSSGSSPRSQAWVKSQIPSLWNWRIAGGNRFALPLSFQTIGEVTVSLRFVSRVCSPVLGCFANLNSPFHIVSWIWGKCTRLELCVKFLPSS